MPGPTQNPIEDFADELDGETVGGVAIVKGTNLRLGRVLLLERGSLALPSPCVFINAEGGTPPRGVMGTARENDFSTMVEVYARSARHDYEGGLNFARALLAFLHHRDVTNYVSVRAMQSEPIHDDENSADQHVFLSTFRVDYHA